jgi:hypothetical protein
MEGATAAGVRDSRPESARGAAIRGLLVRAAPVAAIVGVSALVWGALAFLSPTPWVFPDELIYSEMAKSIAHGQLPAIRDVSSLGYGVIYPLLIAPAWLVGDNVAAYEIAHVVNAVLMSLVAVPAYFLSRQFVERRHALLVSTFSVVVPAMAYVATLMTEVALYPAFVLALLAISWALRRPSVRVELLVFGAITLAFGIKSFAVVLIPIYATSLVLLAATEPGQSRMPVLKKYRVSWTLILGAPLLATVVGLARNGDPFALLGAYAVTAGNVDPVGTVRWFVGNLSALVLSIAVIPFAGTVIAVSRGFSSGAVIQRRIYSCVATPTVIFVLLLVGAFGSKPVAGAEGFLASTPLRERNFFMVAPVLLLGLVLWTTDRRRSPRTFGVVAVVSLALVVLYPWGSVPTSAGPQNLSSITWIVVAPDGWVRVVTCTLFAAGALLLFGLVPWTKVGRLWMAMGALFVFTGFLTALVFASASQRTLDWGAGNERGWIDNAIGSGARVSVLWNESKPGYAAAKRRHRVVWVNEFFNESIRDVYTLGGKMPYAMPESSVDLGLDGFVQRAGRRVNAEYVLACGIKLDSQVIARNDRTGAVLYDVHGGVRVVGAPRECAGGQAH